MINDQRLVVNELINYNFNGPDESGFRLKPQ